MKAITLDQPYATLVVLGIKTWETRPAPFNGDMRPAGVRGLPGLRINRGDRIAIHAAAQRPRNYEHHHVDADLPLWIDLVEMSRYWDWWEYEDFLHGGMYRWRGPLGAIVGYVTVADTRPIVDDHTLPDPPRDFIRHAVHEQEDRLSIVRHEGRINLGSLGRPHSWSAPGDISAQLPYGDWTPGRWASLLVDPEPCEPIPAKGKQGVWEWTP